MATDQSNFIDSCDRINDTSLDESAGKSFIKQSIDIKINEQSTTKNTSELSDITDLHSKSEVCISNPQSSDNENPDQTENIILVHKPVDGSVLEPSTNNNTAVRDFGSGQSSYEIPTDLSNELIPSDQSENLNTLGQSSEINLHTSDKTEVVDYSDQSENIKLFGITEHDNSNGPKVTDQPSSVYSRDQSEYQVNICPATSDDSRSSVQLSDSASESDNNSTDQPASEKPDDKSTEFPRSNTNVYHKGKKIPGITAGIQNDTIRDKESMSGKSYSNKLEPTDSKNEKYSDRLQDTTFDKLMQSDDIVQETSVLLIDMKNNNTQDMKDRASLTTVTGGLESENITNKQLHETSDGENLTEYKKSDGSCSANASQCLQGDTSLNLTESIGSKDTVKEKDNTTNNMYKTNGQTTTEVKDGFKVNHFGFCLGNGHPHGTHTAHRDGEKVNIHGRRGSRLRQGFEELRSYEVDGIKNGSSSRNKICGQNGQIQILKDTETVTLAEKCKSAFADSKDHTDTSPISKATHVSKNLNKKTIWPLCKFCKGDIPRSCICEDCHLISCKTCFERIHQVDNHTVLIANPPDIWMETCYRHNYKFNRYYCWTCNGRRCADCIILGPVCKRDHKIVKIKEYYTKQREELQEKQTRISSTCIDKIDNTLTAIDTKQNEIEIGWMTQKEILRHEFVSLHDVITECEKELLCNLEKGVQSSLCRLSDLKDKYCNALGKEAALTSDTVNLLQNKSNIKFNQTRLFIEHRWTNLQEETQKLESLDDIKPAILDHHVSFFEEKRHIQECLKKENYCSMRVRPMSHCLYIPWHKLHKPMKASEIWQPPATALPSTQIQYNVQIRSHTKKILWETYSPIDIDDVIINNRFGVFGIALRPSMKYLMKITPIYRITINLDVKAVREEKPCFVLIVTEISGTGDVKIDIAFLCTEEERAEPMDTDSVDKFPLRLRSINRLPMSAEEKRWMEMSRNQLQIML